jgi:hypothetical protein
VSRQLTPDQPTKPSPDRHRACPGLRQQALERHYRINQLVQLWSLSRRSIIRLVDQKMGKVPTIGKRRSRYGPIKRPYVTRTIPEGIVHQIYKDLLKGPG